MDTVSKNTPVHATLRPPVRKIEGDLSRGLILLCDHASNHLPNSYGTLGLDEREFERHIAYDIGAEALTRAISRVMNVPALLTSHSRLLVDPNRGEDDPTIIMKLSDGTIIGGNHPIDQAEAEYRIENFHRPYHRAITSMIDDALTIGIVPMIFSIHSFTDNWKGNARPWQVSILWDDDARLPHELLRGLRAQGDIVVGDNEPYDGALGADTMYTHGTCRGLAHGLVEVRQDLIGDEIGVEEWAERLVRALEPAIKLPQMHEINYGTSRTGPVSHVRWGKEESGDKQNG